MHGFIVGWRVCCALVLSLVSPFALAGEYYYTLDSQGSNPSAIHYPSADAACHVAYDAAASRPANPDRILQPYASPTLQGEIPPNIQIFMCSIVWTGADGNGFYNESRFVYRNGDDCTASESFNPQTGKCESPDAEQDRKELGDPTSAANVGFVSCGDPVNPANGNVYESEVDYADTAGTLRFERSYNSNGRFGGWSTTLDTKVVVDRDPSFRGAVVVFQDGRSALFTNKNGVLTADGGEFGSLQKTASGWVYRSPADDVMTFDAGGTLTRWDFPGGKFITVATTTTPPFDQSQVVTDDMGRSFVYNSSLALPKSLVVGDLTISYSVDSMRRLTGITKVRGGWSSSRSYLYEDTRFPTKLTGIVDERGIRVSTWSYDASGRAISAIEADGSGRFSFAYNSDGSTTVTNPLGHPVGYHFGIVQGAKRITAIQGEPVAGCPAANSTFAYTANAKLASRTDAVGHTTTFSYDTQGRETSRTEAKGTSAERTISTTWDGTSFRPKTVTTPDRQTTYSYDAQGRLLSTTLHSVKD